MKLVVEEQGSGEAEAVWEDADRIVSSTLLYVEARSAVGRAVRDGRLTLRRASASRRLLTGLWNQVERVTIDERLVRNAGDLAESLALRAYDSVHLASALTVRDDDVAFVSADRVLLDAAELAALATVPVG